MFKNGLGLARVLLEGWWQTQFSGSAKSEDVISHGFLMVWVAVWQAFSIGK